MKMYFKLPTFIAFTFILGYSSAFADEMKCYSNAEFMKLIDEKGMVSIFNGSKGPKVNEVLMSKDRHVFAVEYEKATDGNALKSSSYCVVSIVDDVTFNDSAIEFLYKILEKTKGKAT